MATRIEHLMETFVLSVFEPSASPSLTLVRRTRTNLSNPNELPHFEDQATQRHLSVSGATILAKTMKVLALVYVLVKTGKRATQREIYYMLIESFVSQAELNDRILDCSACLGVPRCMMNIDVATRGVVAGCIKITTQVQTAIVDCEAVDTSGWPIPGDIQEVLSCQIVSRALYIVGTLFASLRRVVRRLKYSSDVKLTKPSPSSSVIEKYGIFARLVQDRFYHMIPSVLVCGKGYPSVSTRAFVALIERKLRIPVLGLADYNPHGLALLQTYRRGSVRSSLEGSQFCRLFPGHLFSCSYLESLCF